MATAGEIIVGKYRVERVLGQGGMGVVVAAHHIQLDQMVALKFLLPEAMVSKEAVTRFIREARAAAKIKNEHVARVIDVGQLENGAPYMVMEYLEGSDLSAMVARRGALGTEETVDFVLQACEAIAEAHSLGIVHRDLKPANLFCLEKADGSVTIKVLDFGISKIASPDLTLESMTKTGGLLGSPLYMSPEQMQRSKGVDARADIWSLGIILFELLAGSGPFAAETMTELIFKIATERPASIRTLRGDVVAGLEQVILRCLEKNREDRYQSVGELAEALVGFASPRGRLSVEGVQGTARKARGSGAQLIALTDPSAPTRTPGHAPTMDPWGRTAAPTALKPNAGSFAAALAVGVLVVGATALAYRVHASTVRLAPMEPSAAAPGAPPPATARDVVLPVEPTPAPDHIQSATPATTTPGAPMREHASSTPVPPPRQTNAKTATIAPPPAASSRSCRLLKSLDARGEPHFSCPCESCL